MPSEKAYQQQGRFLSSDGHFLFQKALHIAKKLRAEFEIKPVRSLAEHVCSHILETLQKDETIFFLGQSELNQQIYQKLSQFQNLEVCLVSRTKPDAASVFSKVNYLHYDELISARNIKRIVCATKELKLTGKLNLDPLGYVYDLSRPKIFDIQHQNYLDLAHFESISQMLSLKQQLRRMESLEYIQQNVRRLIQSRQLKLIKSVS